MLLKNNRGSLLVITLWLVTLLSIFAVAMARYVSVELKLTRYRIAKAQARAWARGGVYLAMQQLAIDPTSSYDWMGDRWSSIPGDSSAAPAPQVFALPVNTPRSEGSVMSVQIADEERLLDVNTASLQTLGNLLQSPDAAQLIRDYVDADAETPLEEPPYYPKNSPAAVCEELIDIPSMNALWPRAQAHLTSFIASSSVPTVNINTAQREVLVALGASASTVDALIAARPGADHSWGTPDDCKATSAATAAAELADCVFGGDHTLIDPLFALNNVKFSVASSVFHVEVEVAMQTGKIRQHVEAIVKREGKDAWPIILAWRER